MKKIQSSRICIIFLLTFLLLPAILFAASPPAADKGEPGSVKTILDALEKRFAVQGFSADFSQESPLPDLGISETAKGLAFFRKPEKFRWEYTEPDILHYISDGNNLWIHSLQDNNVWVGKTATFFGKGSSAGFLTDIPSIRKKFKAALTESPDKSTWTLELTPVGTSTFGINKVFLSINKNNSDISKITTFNYNNEETRITLSNYNFKVTPSEPLFTFEIPEKANIIPLE